MNANEFNKVSILDTSSEYTLFINGNEYDATILSCRLPISDIETIDDEIYTVKTSEGIFDVRRKALTSSIDDYTTIDIDRHIFTSCLYNSGYDIISGSISTFVFEDNGIQRRDVIVSSVIYDYAKFKLSAETNFDENMAHYSSYSECLRNSEWDEYDSDGNIKGHFKGDAILLKMNEEQEEYISRLRDVLKEAKDHGIYLGFDLDYSEVCAYNIKPFTDYNHDYESYDENDRSVVDIRREGVRVYDVAYVGSEDTIIAQREDMVK